MTDETKSKYSAVLSESIFDNMLDGLAYCQMVFDAQGHPADFVYMRVNKNFEKLTGLKEVEGKKVTELIPGISASNPDLFEVYGRVSLTGKPEKFETYIKPLAKWFFISVYSPQKKFFVSAFEDITDRKRIEKNLEDARIAARNVLEDLSIEKSKVEMAKAKDEAIFSSIGDGLIVTDEKGNIVLVNEAFEKLLGWSAKEVIGRKMLDVVQKVDEKGEIIPPGKRSLRKVLTGEISVGKASNIIKTHSYIRKDKSKLPITGVVTPVILDGKVLGAVQVFRDVTYEQGVDKAKTEFVTLASHQLRTPLSIINWYIEMLFSGDAGKVNENQKKYLKEAYKASKRMVDLVNTLLNVSRLEMGTFVIEPESVNIAKAVKACLEELKPQILDKKLILREEYDPGIPLVLFDPKFLTIVFQNLLSNAVKYTPEKGNINLSLALDNKKKAVIFKVSDTGYGIPKNQQDKIFTKLFRADNVREKNTEGTGLGLYIVKAIMDHSGGFVRFESPSSATFDKATPGKEENKGTTFYVTLPLAGMKKKEGDEALAQ